MLPCWLSPNSKNGLCVDVGVCFCGKKEETIMEPKSSSVSNLSVRQLLLSIFSNLLGGEGGKKGAWG